MNITYACPKCDHGLRADVTSQTEVLACDQCQGSLNVPPGAIKGDAINRCLVCPSTELFVRKDFPQQLGVAIVVLGFAASTVAWFFYQIYWTFGILFATAAVDVILYVFMGEALICYRCGAQYRGGAELEGHSGFNLETHERYRQQAARMQEVAAASRGSNTV